MATALVVVASVVGVDDPAEIEVVVAAVVEELAPAQPTSNSAIEEAIRRSRGIPRAYGPGPSTHKALASPASLAGTDRRTGCARRWPSTSTDPWVRPGDEGAAARRVVYWCRGQRVWVMASVLIGRSDGKGEMEFGPKKKWRSVPATLVGP